MAEKLHTFREAVDETLCFGHADIVRGRCLRCAKGSGAEPPDALTEHAVNCSLISQPERLENGESNTGDPQISDADGRR